MGGGVAAAVDIVCGWDKVYALVGLVGLNFVTHT
jgi:hypothetical protein